MPSFEWSKQVSTREAFRRVGGRKRHNAKRQREQLKRRVILLRVLSLRELGRGDQKELAAQFNVSKATISKDVAWAIETCGGMCGSGIMPRITTRYGRVVSACWKYRGPAYH